MSLKQPSRELEVTMVVSSRTLELMNCVMNLELDINSRPSTLHNQMILLRERIEHSLIERSMLSEYNVSQSFWAEAINMACYCSNRLYCHPLKEKTPYELLMVESPTLHIFGFLVANAIS